MELNAATLAVMLATLSGMACADNGDGSDYFDMALDELMQLNVATGTPRTLRDAPAVATVITAQDLQAMGARTLEEALAMVPGLHVSHSSPIMTPKFLFRGIGTDTFNPQTLVLVNGLPQTSLVRSDRGNVWRWLPIRHIARIEVIRGPGSALYGAEAFGGVINLITYDADSQERDDIGVGVGSYQTTEAWARQSFQLGGWRGAWSVQGLTTDGPREPVPSDLQSQLDAVSQSIPGIDHTPRSRAPGVTSLSVQGFDLNLDLRKGSWSLRATHADRRDIGSAVGIAEALDPTGRLAGTHTSLEVQYANPAWRENWGLEARLSRFEVGQDITSPLYIFPVGAFAFALPFDDGVIGMPEFDERTLRLDVGMTYTGFAGHRLRFGLGFADAEVYSIRELKNFGMILLNTPTGPAPLFVPLGELIDATDTPAIWAPEGGRRSRSLFIQDEWQLADRWQLVYGVRHDRYSDFGGTTNPRAALVWTSSDTFTSKLLYGTAFRAPSWCELYCINNPVAFGNPALKPERLRNIELAFAWTPSAAWMVGLNVFAYRLSDGLQLIYRPEGQVAQNLGKYDGRGAELEFRYRNPSARWSLLGNASYAKATDQALDTPVGLAPQRRAYLRFDWKFDERYSLDVQMSAVGERLRVQGDPRPPLDGFVNVDANLRVQQLWHGMELNLGLRNLFDADIREPASTSIPDDLPMPGRNVWLSISWPL